MVIPYLNSNFEITNFKNKYLIHEHLRRLTSIDGPSLYVLTGQSLQRCAVRLASGIQQIPSEHPRLISCLPACVRAWTFFFLLLQLHLETTSFSLFFFSFLSVNSNFRFLHRPLKDVSCCLHVSVRLSVCLTGFQIGASDKRNV